VRVVGVHLPSPITIGLLKQSVAEVKVLADLASRRDSGSLIIAGDFNAPTTTWQYGAILDAGLVESFAAAGAGNGVTRPRQPFPPGELGGIRIDHIFACGKLRFISSIVGTDVGSDHRPVIAELVRAPVR
jgi:vancomycin resistance protein VanJ